jgi:mannose/fructose/N-acetylgalactosamine-specific phosphotransferase system component IIC
VSIPFQFEQVALLALISGVLAVDERAGWQGLFAQPVVSGALVGIIFGDFISGVSVGVILELVWLSILPMRGMRRPDAVAGSIVGAGTAVLLARNTGDPRTLFIIALGALLGLIAGELAGSVGRRIHRVRERQLGRMKVSDDAAVLERRLVGVFAASVGFIVVAEMLLVGVMLPLSLLGAERLTAVAGDSVTTGARWWGDIVPVLGAGALIQMYWYKQHNRYLVLSAAVVLMLLWIL